MRDAQGRFVKGHKPIPERDPVTGCFVSSNKSMDRYTKVSHEVDRFLEQLEQDNTKRGT